MCKYTHIPLFCQFVCILLAVLVFLDIPTYICIPCCVSVRNVQAPNFPAARGKRGCVPALEDRGTHHCLVLWRETSQHSFPGHLKAISLALDTTFV